MSKRGRRAKRSTEFLFPDMAKAAAFVKIMSAGGTTLQFKRRARRVEVGGLLKNELYVARQHARTFGGDIVLASKVGREAQAECEAALGRRVRVEVGRSPLNKRARIFVVGEIVHASVANITEEGRPLFSIEVKHGPAELVRKGVFGKIPKAWSGSHEAPRKRRRTMAKKKKAKKEKKSAKKLPEGDVKSLLKKLETATDAEEKKLLRRALRNLGHKGGLRKSKTVGAKKKKAKTKKGKRAKKA